MHCYPLGSVIVQGNDPTAPDALAASRSMMIPLLFVVKGNSGNQTVKTEALEVFTLDLRTQKTQPTAMNFANAMDSVFRELGMPMNSTGTPTNTNIAGHEFTRFTSILHLNGGAVHVTDHATMTKGFILTFQVMSSDSDELQKLESIMNTLQFSQPAE